MKVRGHTAHKASPHVCPLACWVCVRALEATSIIYTLAPSTLAFAVIVDTATYASNLPGSLRAVFFLDSSDGEAVQHARDVHAGYLAEYPELTAERVPLLRLSLRNPTRPFTRVA